MATETDSKFPQPGKNRRAFFATNDRKIQRIDADIFEELLPNITRSLARLRLSHDPRQSPSWQAATESKSLQKERKK
jgi:hypothetical protein